MHHRDGKRFVVRADEKLTAFLELESTVRKRQRTRKTEEDDTDSESESARFSVVRSAENSIDTVWLEQARLHRRQVRWASPQELHLTLFSQGKP